VARCDACAQEARRVAPENVRTTLKRGYGRSAGADGNGRTTLPPDALTPVTVYAADGAPRRGRWGLLGRLLGVLAAAVLMLGVSLAGGVYLWVHESVAAVSPHSEDVKNAVARLAGVPPADKAAVALVIGYDSRAGEAKGVPSRSDTLMLLRYDPETEAISMLSFPRDMIVEHPLPRLDVQVQDQRRVRDVRSGRSAGDGTNADRAADQLPRHGQLPRLQEDRQHTRRRLGRRRPALLQRQRGGQLGLQLRRDQPAARLPAPHRWRCTRLRSLPAHGLRLPPCRAAAAVRDGHEGAVPQELLRDEGARACGRYHEERRGRRRRWQGAHSADDPPLRPCCLRPAPGPLLPGEDRGPDGLLGADHRLAKRPRSGLPVHAPGRPGPSAATAVALGQDQDLRAATRRHDGVRPQRLHGAGPPRRRYLSQRGYTTIDPGAERHRQRAVVESTANRGHFDPGRRAPGRGLPAAQTFGARPKRHTCRRRSTGPPIRQPHACLVQPLE
jgi:hypothetical protein